nr:putative ORF1 [Marmot picobirnavirus]
MKCTHLRKEVNVTKNQLDYLGLVETRRNNIVVSDENARHNRNVEDESVRHNRSTEEAATRGNLIAQQQADETKRNNLVLSDLRNRELAETSRHNKQTEGNQLIVSERQADTNLQTALINAGSQREASKRSANASKYSTKQQAKTQRQATKTNAQIARERINADVAMNNSRIAIDKFGRELDAAMKKKGLKQSDKESIRRAKTELDKIQANDPASKMERLVNKATSWIDEIPGINKVKNAGANAIDAIVKFAQFSTKISSEALKPKSTKGKSSRGGGKF